MEVCQNTAGPLYLRAIRVGFPPYRFPLPIPYFILFYSSAPSDCLWGALFIRKPTDVPPTPIYTGETPPVGYVDVSKAFSDQRLLLLNIFKDYIMFILKEHLRNDIFNIWIN